MLHSQWSSNLESEGQDQHPRKNRSDAVRFVALAGVITGSVNLLAPQPMRHHLPAIGVPWDDLWPSFQVLVLASLKVGGAGLLCVGIALGLLLSFPFLRGERWAQSAVPTLGLAFWVPTLSATATVTVRTKASATGEGSLASVMCPIRGLVLCLSAVMGSPSSSIER